MRRPLFFLVLLVSLYCKNNYAQFSFGASYELSAIQTQSEFLNYLQVYNENETWDLYRLNQNLGTLAQGIGVRSFGQRFSNNTRWQIGYSMELGYRFFRSFTIEVIIMATTNPTTGDALRSRAPTKKYDDGWDRIFGKKDKPKSDKKDDSQKKSK